MRNIIWVLVAVIIGAAGYLLWSGQSLEDVANDAAGAVSTLQGGTESEAASE